MKLLNKFTFTLVSQRSLTLSLDHPYTDHDMNDAKKWPSDKVKEHCENNVDVHSVVQLSI